MAGGRAGVFRPGRRMPHGVPLPADAAHVHGDRARGPLPDHRHHAPDPGDPRHLPVGDLPAQPRRADPRDGHRPGARLSVGDLCRRPQGAAQSRHPPPPRAADGARPAPGRADEQPAAVDARHAGHLLRRRDRHGRQHPSRRPRRRAHADAVVARPQRRLLARRPGQPGAAADHGPAVRLRGGERRGAGGRPAFAAELDAPDAGGARPVHRARPRQPAVPVSRQPQDPGVPARIRRRRCVRDHPVREQPLAQRPGGRTGAVGIRRKGAGGGDRRRRVPPDRPAALSADPAAVRLPVVRAEHRDRAAAMAPAGAAAAAGIRHPGGAPRRRPR